MCEKLSKGKKMHWKTLKCMGRKEHGKVVFFGDNKKECAERYHHKAGDEEEDGLAIKCQAQKECDPNGKCTTKWLGDHAKMCEKLSKGKKMHWKTLKCMGRKEHGKVVFFGDNKKECAERYHHKAGDEEE